MSDVTQILSQIESGDSASAEKLLPLVYQELRRIAGIKMAQENPVLTLQPTALVHEAYIRLVDVKSAQKWNSRGHFFAAAAEAMRRILVERARKKASIKGGGQLQRVEVFEEPGICDPGLNMLALDDALSELEKKSPRRAEVVKLRFFAGLTNAQIAAALGVAVSTVDADWAYARCWLRVEMAEDDAENQP